MRNRLIMFFVFAALILGVCVLIFIYGEISGETVPRLSPCLNNGKKWRLGYIQGGTRHLYPRSLIALVDGLSKLGWLKPVDWTKFSKNIDTKQIWRFLSECVESDYLEFSRELYWDARRDRQQRSENRRHAIELLRGSERVDLIIAMGSWAGQDLAVSAHNVPVVAINSPNPVAAGILRADLVPALPHVYVGYEPDIVIRQVRIYQLICGFKRLGVVYDRSNPDENRGGLSYLRTVADQGDFELDVVEVTLRDVPQPLAKKHLLKAYRELAPRVDAMWITADMINQPAIAKELLAPFFEHKVPTWTTLGETAVRNGVMLSASRSEAIYGLNNARVVAKILNGTLPGDLIGEVHNKYEMVINHAVAQRIGFSIPVGLSAAIDKSYLSITKEHENVQRK